MSGLPERSRALSFPSVWPSEVEKLFDDNAARLRGYLLSVGCPEPDVDDVIQDSILIVARRYASLDRPEMVRTYWYRIASRLAWKLLKERRDRSLPGDPADYLQALPDPVEGAVDPDGRQAALALVHRLPLRQRQVLWLRVVVGFSEAETAEVLQISVGTVKSQCSDAKKNMKKFVESSGETREEGTI
ncbi:RNA polymerase sigma factor, sigma-70 family [Frankia torreyi]|uniref:RNA polymerase sigma factor, sigma-70 family n=1 Tax=Frankia torreyi TaxID=1856 RepID=A0A0D8BG93_9ACTN|nr:MULTISPECIES: sigma-70 family RNA polymerase sigma factor [Frankia]KJE22447.1 RNA polymerase sigma factor, sigma-70 family [Frankia torreyi]KQC37444.1 RNA polymerase [Frankia sp. ACN1ag]KQM05051.1 RNA polymerase sigma factor, sigma-70 family [Frankia sp. CpI1-P]